MPPRAAYGSYNPNAGKPANGNRDAWGGYAWENCPPDSLLGSTDYTSKYGQHLRVQIRRELVPLLGLMFAICDKHDYVVYGIKNGENWGPWGFECRAISGTSTPSGHSMALSFDVNAPNNAYSATFQCDMPPAMVADIESCGFYWGGRYEGQRYDAMHYGYCWTPADVPRHLIRARAILGTGGSGTTTPSTPTKPTAPVLTPEQIEENELMAAKDDIINEGRPLGLVRATTSGAVWAFGPGTFVHISPSQMAAGVKAGLYQPNVTLVTPQELDALQSASLAQNTGGQPSQVSPLAPAKPPVATKPTTYTVKATDSDGFNAVAKRLGVTPAALKAANPKVDINNINVGQVLNVPK